MKDLLGRLSRRRPIESPPGSSLDDTEEGGGDSGMDRCLTTLDLVSIGVGSSCGTGMYLTAGIICGLEAGPGGAISILLAGLVSVMTGLHYAELSGLCPHTSGSAYMYTYITVGELSAFVIGWGSTLEYIIGTATNAVALSKAIRTLDSFGITESSTKLFTDRGLPPVDLLAIAICMLLTWTLASGVKMSARVNNALNMLSCTVWVVFLVCALCIGSPDNISQNGGFFPMGLDGVMDAIPTAYFAFIGFDGLTTTGGECINPVKAIPYSIFTSICINIFIFCTIVIGLAYVVPYSSLPANTAVVEVFAITGQSSLKIFMMVGAVAGLFAATFGSLFPLPRVLQSMAQDGLLFRFLSHIDPRRQTALRATVMSGATAALLAGVVEIGLLIELVLVGTLLAYILVTLATLVSRYVALDGGNCCCSPLASPVVTRRPRSRSAAPTLVPNGNVPDQGPWEKLSPGKQHADEKEETVLPVRSRSNSTQLTLDSNVWSKSNSAQSTFDPNIRSRSSSIHSQVDPNARSRSSSIHSQINANVRSRSNSTQSQIDPNVRSRSNSTHVSIEPNVLSNQNPNHSPGRGRWFPTESTTQNSEKELLQNGNAGSENKRRHYRSCSNGSRTHSSTKDVFKIAPWDDILKHSDHEPRTFSDKTPLLRTTKTNMFKRLTKSPFSVIMTELYREVGSWVQSYPKLFLLTYMSMFALCFMLSHFMENIRRLEGWAIVMLSMSFIMTLSLSLRVVCLPLRHTDPLLRDVFKAPMVPFITLVTAAVNIYLMTSLRLITWFIFFVWMLIGLAIYFLYGMGHSSMQELTNQTAPLGSRDLFADNPVVQSDCAKSSVTIDEE